MKITMLQLIAAVPALSHLMQQPVPASLAFRLRKFTKITGPIVEAFNEQRDKLITTLGTLMPNETDKYHFSEENRVKFNSELQPILEQEVEVPELTFTEQDFSKVEVSVVHLAQLEPFIKE